jgi:glycosyltransferase involved in cell wall biosynthesis
MSKKIVLVNQSTGFLMIDVANAFADKYDKVTLIAGEINKLEREINPKISIDKIVRYNKKSALSRLFTWLFGTVQILFKLLFRYRKYEVLFVTNPPMAYLLASMIKNSFSILIYDTYPDTLKNIGITEKKFLYKFWSISNKKIFPKAKKIFTLSEGMAKNLSKYVPTSNITIIPNWSGSEKISPIPKDKNIFLRDKDFKDDFIVLYSGNMGYTHNVEVIVEVAKLTKNVKNIHYLFIGEGKKKAELIKFAKDHNLTNCSFMTWQDSEVMPYSLASASLGVVSLNQENALLSVPSKTYNLLAVGVPLLSISPEESELSELIKKYHNGRNFTENQTKEICDFIIFCRDHPDQLKHMSDQSLIASKDFTFKNALQYVDSLLKL